MIATAKVVAQQAGGGRARQPSRATRMCSSAVSWPVQIRPRRRCLGSSRRFWRLTALFQAEVAVAMAAFALEVFACTDLGCGRWRRRAGRRHCREGRGSGPFRGRETERPRRRTGFQFAAIHNEERFGGRRPHRGACAIPSRPRSALCFQPGARSRLVYRAGGGFALSLCRTPSQADLPG